jgi:hypothetical protein
MPMNSSHRNIASPDERTIADLLEAVRVQFYAGSQPAQFHRDRRMLLYALTWPAHWLDRRGLFCSPHRYRSLVADRLDAIRAHGDPARFGAYLPSYLLKCLQDFFDRHGDELYCELKHIRNALDCLQATLAKCQRASEQSRHIEAIAAAHRILRNGYHGPPQTDPHQIALF